MHKLCLYSNWSGLSAIDWAAWVQAVGSIMAIAVAIALPHWSKWRQDRERARTIVELMTYSTSVCLLAKTVLKSPDGKARGYAEAAMDRAVTLMEGVKYLDAPDPVISVCLQEVLLMTVTMRGYLAHVRANSLTPAPTQVDAFFDRHIGVMSRATSAASSRGKVTPRSMPAPPLEW